MYPGLLLETSRETALEFGEDKQQDEFPRLTGERVELHTEILSKHLYAYNTIPVYTGNKNTTDAEEVNEQHIFTSDNNKSVARALIGSRLDYANSVMHGLSSSNVARL